MKMTTSDVLRRLPPPLQERLDALFQQSPSARATIEELVQHLTTAEPIDDDLAVLFFTYDVHEEERDG